MIYRTSLPPIPTPTAQCLFPSSLEVIRPQFQLPLVTLKTGWFIYQLETSITMYDTPIEMALFFLVFWQFLKVSVGNSVLHITYITILVLVAKKYADDDGYCNFRQQLLHMSLVKTLDSLKLGMTMQK
jgi:hypothetical protein